MHLTTLGSTADRVNPDLAGDEPSPVCFCIECRLAIAAYQGAYASLPVNDDYLLALNAKQTGYFARQGRCSGIGTPTE